ncbi:MAG: tail fiber protein [Cytophagales bacterium]
MNMGGGSARGWTWGSHGAVPIAGLNTQGHMQIAGGFTANTLRTGSGSITSNYYGALLLGHGDRSDDSDYEWTGFYSGTTRQGIILYDGAWSGANNLTNEFSITAENGNILTLNTQGNSDIALMPDGSGKVGIGSTSPSSKLHLTSPIERESLRVYKDGNTSNYLNVWQGTGAAALDPIGTGLLYLGYDQSTDVIIGNAGGSLGIGTTTPDSKLTVKGNIHAQEVKVDLNGAVAPDYVFERDYPLQSLEELKSYIDQNKHLPEIPSAKQMEEEGINLKEMNLLLLRKIEEMTLHLIDQNEQMEKLQEESRVRAEASAKKAEELMLHLLLQSEKTTSQEEEITSLKNEVLKLINKH